jgi:hypothetical protein
MRFLNYLNGLGKSSHSGRRRPRTEKRGSLPTLEALEDRRLMTAVTSPNLQAPIIPNVQIETVYYGSAWSGQAGNPALSAELSAEAKDLDQFFGAITGSHYMDGLSQYSMTTPHGTVIRPGYGSFARHDFVAGQFTSGQSVSEDAIQTMLSQEIQRSALDAPNGNTLYVVFMPPGVVEGFDSSHQYAGHHSSFAYGSGTAYFATIEYPTSGGTPKGNLGNETNFQYMTEVASHEMVEAITNPMVNVASQAAWKDQTTGNEIGDITQLNPPPGGAMGLEGPAGYGYVVQKYWSNQANTSVIPGGTNYQGIGIVPRLSNFGFGLIDQNGQTTIGTWGDYTWASSDGSQATFAGTFGGQAVTVYVSANVGQKLTVTIYSPANTILFSGTMSQPSGSWRNETPTADFLAPDYAELSGTLYRSGQGLTAFGTGGAIYPPQFTGAGYGSSYGGQGDGPQGQFNNYNAPNRHRHAYE